MNDFTPSEFSREASVDTVRTRTEEEVLVDNLYEDPVDRRQLRTRRIFFWGGLVVIVVLIVLGVAGA